jgi:chromosomal replication initiator protein
MDVVVESGIWDGILHSIRRNLSGESFETWFKPIQFEGIDSSRRIIRLRAPNQIVKDWVNINYTNLVDQSLIERSLPGYALVWVVEEKELTSLVSQNASVKEGPRAGSLSDARSNPLVNLYQDAGYESPRPLDVAESPINTGATEPSLSQKYTYDSFVVGSCNQFAHAASLAVAEAPGKTYNPLYLYGGVGLGKTHLMHACGNKIKQRNSHLRLCYLSSEKFMNELINAIRYDKTQIFREKYRSVDVLLIDDVQFMAGKERTQEEFFHTFNSLYEQQKQIVISSDCPPREIPTLEERLHSRFEWGLIADIEPPDLETKVAILKRKAEIMGVNMPDDVALFIASRVKNNVRELE